MRPWLYIIEVISYIDVQLYLIKSAIAGTSSPAVVANAGGCARAKIALRRRRILSKCDTCQSNGKQNNTNHFLHVFSSFFKLKILRYTYLFTSETQLKY